MKKTLIFFLCFLLLPWAASAQTDAYMESPLAGHYGASRVIETPWNLVFWHKDGSIVLFNLGEMPKVTYSGDRVIVQSSSIVEYEFQSIKKMSYSTEDIDRINDLTIKPNKPFTNSGETITFLPAEEDLNVRIILLNGIVIKDFLVRKGESSTISLNSSPEKLYLINVNGETYKIKIR